MLITPPRKKFQKIFSLKFKKKIRMIFRSKAAKIMRISTTNEDLQVHGLVVTSYERCSKLTQTRQ
jgi:hypothetical protein